MKTPSSSSRTGHHYYLYYYNKDAKDWIFAAFIVGGASFVCGVIYLSFHYLYDLDCPIPIINLQEMNWNYTSNTQQQNFSSDQSNQNIENSEVELGLTYAHNPDFRFEQASRQSFRYRRNVQNG